jgi:ribosome maturation factor RimP
MACARFHVDIWVRMGVVTGPAAQARFVQETGVAATIAALAEPVLEGLGFRLVRVRIMGGQDTIVEIMAERPDGSMTVEDCKSVSVNLSPLLDVHEPLPGSYRLQISSPGIDRPLVRPSDFEHWAGHETKIELKEPIGGRKRFRGTLDGYEDEEVRVAVDLGKDGQQVLGFPIGLIADARLVLTDDLIRESLRRAKKNEAETSRP